MMLLQQNMTQIQHNRHLGLGSLPSPAEAELYQYYLAQNMNLPNLKMDSAASDAQFMMSGFQLDPTGPMAAMTPALVGGEIPLDMRLGGGQLVSEELMNLGESFIQTNDPSLKLFQCAVCNKFTTDNLDMLGLHMNVERNLSEDEWKAVMGDSYQCKLCRYNTQLKANFQLHCKTDKHVQKYQLVAHIKEGGKANEWRLKCVAIGNPVHLKCNACDYYTNSLEKLRLHTVNSRHEASLKLYKNLSSASGVPFGQREVQVSELELGQVHPIVIKVQPQLPSGEHLGEGLKWLNLLPGLGTLPAPRGAVQAGSPQRILASRRHSGPPMSKVASRRGSSCDPEVIRHADLVCSSIHGVGPVFPMLPEQSFMPLAKISHVHWAMGSRFCEELVQVLAAASPSSLVDSIVAFQFSEHNGSFVLTPAAVSDPSTSVPVAGLKAPSGVYAFPSTFLYSRKACNSGGSTVLSREVSLSWVIHSVAQCGVTNPEPGLGDLG
ncbi:Zinc finger homeobox protein 3 [Tupaia chinensis]|uniref:Zinc finger homeobox protein 3 n=1 Tax=Tupaia chinensis TaxID=246437 RepID=L9KJG1_TUPCH|nr:Zinc finger homeobox protein 3 [Tupaia chinensis]